MRNYLEQVYAGVLGKVIGVYMGRPVEGWKRDRIEERFGDIDRYVADDVGVPLIVADDDISGTFTFIRALEDSGLFEDTPPAFFGDNWLNYLIEKRTVLWWGGLGYSTEHTAFIRLKHGIKSPESGSAAINGKVVSEQIGAQIFIDCFGMVAPGNPELAMRLAEMAARVSHDGEAVIGAKVVAAMVSMAFEIKDIHTILDKVVDFIPKESLIAQVHSDVRSWVREDRDWRKTFARIDEKYGYAKFGGGCHMIPNHAAMVMAWEYAGNDFHKAQVIINSAGWDTDCNAANVGSVMGLICGLDGIVAKYDFRSPFADRLIIPTANGTDSVSDCLRIARRIARIGCRISKLETTPDIIGCAYHDFALKGALHGYVANQYGSVKWSSEYGGSALFSFPGNTVSHAAITTPVSLLATSHSACATNTNGYATASTPFLYHGMTATVEIANCSIPGGIASAWISVLCQDNDGNAKSFRSPPTSLTDGSATTLKWQVECEHLQIEAFSIEVASNCNGSIHVASADFSGEANVRTDQEWFFAKEPNTLPGWICTIGKFQWGRFQQDEGFGALVTGNDYWHDATVSAGFCVHSGDAAGLVLCWQGLMRHYSITVGHGRLKLVRKLYTETTLFEAEVPIAEDDQFKLEASVRNGFIIISLNDKTMASVYDTSLASGAAGICLYNCSMFLTSPLVITANHHQG